MAAVARIGERLWGLVLMALGALWVFDGWRVAQRDRADGMFDSLGPDRYLMLLGALLLLTGAIIALSKPQAVAAKPADEGAGTIGSALLSPPMTFTLLMAGYALLIPRLGYTVSTFIFFFAAYFLAGRRNFVRTLIASVISAGAFYLLFPYLADMSLPTGILGF